MIKNREAFTKKWALFCAGKQFTEDDMVFRGKILENKDFRNKDCARASVRFCYFFHANLSGSRIYAGGDFTGSQWENCQFTGADYRGLTVEMDTFSQCMFGNAKLRNIRMLDIKAIDCSFTGSVWKNVEVQDSVFSDCNFRKVRMEGCRLDRTCFERCMFDETALEETVCVEAVFKNCLFMGRQKTELAGCTFLHCTFEKY